MVHSLRPGLGNGAGKMVRSKFRKMYLRARKQTYHAAGARAPNVPKAWGQRTPHDIWAGFSAESDESSDDDTQPYPANDAEALPSELHSALSQHGVLLHDWNRKATRAIIEEKLVGPLKEEFALLRSAFGKRLESLESVVQVAITKNYDFLRKEELALLEFGNRLESLESVVQVAISKNYDFLRNDTKKQNDVEALKLELFGPRARDFSKLTARELVHVQDVIQLQMKDTKRCLSLLKAQISGEEKAQSILTSIEHAAWKAQSAMADLAGDGAQLVGVGAQSNMTDLAGVGAQLAGVGAQSNMTDLDGVVAQLDGVGAQ